MASDARWTDEAELLVADLLPGWLTAEHVLSALADAGLLVTLKTQAVLHAARDVVHAGQYPGDIRAQAHAQSMKELNEAMRAYVAEHNA
jgi:hypothetical protein